MIVPVNIWAVIVAAVVAMIIGGLWYSPMLFAKQWMKLRGMDHASTAGMKMPMGILFVELVLTLIMAFVIGEFVTWLGIISLVGGLVLGVWLWIGFVAITLMSLSLWEGRAWGLFWINAGVRLVNILVMAAIIGAWR